MDAMRAAIARKRQMSPPPAEYSAESEQAPAEAELEGAPVDQLKSILLKLSDEQKSELLELLQKDVSKESTGVTAADIEKGAASDEEQAQIQAKMAEEDGDSDDIAMSMLDHKAKNAGPEVKPRNLSERVKMSLASKLKAKGKL